MANITETELRRKLKKGGTGGSTGPSARRVGDSWEYSEAVLYLAYASSITNESSSGVITNQSDAVGFQFSAFSSSGALLPWRGSLFSKSIYASGDPTDYIWEDISAGSSASTMERYYSTYSGLLTEMGNPDYPGTMSGGGAVPWVSISPSSPVPDTAFFLAERYTINGVKSTWNVYAVATEENGFGLIPYTITGRNKPLLNSTQWNDDTILAVSAFTGRAYSTIKEFGYGTTVVITYDDGKLYGMLKKVSGVATWVAPIDYIDGALLVDATIIEGKIADNAITVNKILNDAINSDKLADNAVLTAALAANAITTTKIADNAITTGKIIANAITATEIAADAVTANSILAGSVSATKIAANTITAGQIAALAITTSELAAGAVTAAKITAGTITANEIATGSITTAVLAANAITADKIAANAITASKLLITGTGAITPGTIGAGTIASVTSAQTDASQALLDADNALAIADSQVQGFFQNLAPSAVGESFGDIWIDTDKATPVDSTCIYRYEDTAGGSTGTLAWALKPTSALGLAYLEILTNETAVLAAQSTADNIINGTTQLDLSEHNNATSGWTTDAALTTWIGGTYATDKLGLEGQIDGKSIAYFQDTIPYAIDSASDIAANTGDTWYKVTGGELKVFKWVTGTGTSSWDTITDPYIQGAYDDANAAQVTADGKIRNFTATPTTPYELGDVWHGGTSGDIKVCIVERLTGAYVAADWGVASKYTDDTTADGKITSFIQATAPTAEGVGDLWTDTDDSNKLYRWSGTTWVSVRDATIAAAQATADSKVLPAGVAAAINNNTTTIEGSKITTGTISAAHIDTAGLTANEISLSPSDVGVGSSATSGDRLVVTASSIQVYSGSTLRVKLGNLA